MRLKWPVACMGEMRNRTKDCSENMMGRDHLRDLHIDGEDNIKMDLNEIQYEGVDGICVVQDRDQEWVLENMVMNLHIP